MNCIKQLHEEWPRKWLGLIKFLTVKSKFHGEFQPETECEAVGMIWVRLSKLYLLTFLDNMFFCIV